MSQLFRTPELLDTILRDCDKKDLARCTTISHFWFSIAVPYLWEDVTCSSADILRLIAGTKITKHGSEISIPKKLSRDRFVRLQMYTKFTKYLDIRGRFDCRIKYATLLISYAKHSVLLPRLQRLSVGSPVYSEDQFDWVAALFYDSLLEINVVPNLETPPPLSLPTAALWLDTISTKCSKLQTLSLYPYNKWREYDEDIPLSVWEMKHDFYHETHSTMVKLTQLRRLSINMYLTGHETLTAIAGLPNLEHLEIGTTHQEDVFMSLPEPAEGLFPKLRYLALHHISYEDMITALSTEYLLRGLTSLDLVVDPKPIFDDAAQWAWDAFHWGILEENLRQATRLRICFDSVTDDASCVKISEYNMEQLEKIPLRYIFLRKARLDNGDIEGHPFELLVRTWPNITHIHLPDQPANIEDLVYFLSLPHLCHLTLNLNIRPVGNPAPSLHASGPESFKILECSKASCGEEFEPAQVGEIAGFLRSLWPWVTLTWPSDATPLSHSRMRLLQDTIVALY